MSTPEKEEKEVCEEANQFYKGRINSFSITNILVSRKGGDDYDVFASLREWQHHIRVQRTRAEPNYIKVYHNDTLVLDTLMLVPSAEYGYFSFLGTRGASIDNVVVEYEPDIPTPTTSTESATSDGTTTTNGSGDPPDMTMILLIAGGGIAVLVVIVLVVKMRS